MNVQIEYCGAWGYEKEALRVGDLFASRKGADVKLVKSSGGVFEITVDGTLAYSKKSTGRFPEDSELEPMLAG